MTTTLLRFNDESEMYATLLALGGAEETGDPEAPVAVIPQSPIGTIRLRGVMGLPGIYTGPDEHGEMVEVEPDEVWPGYHVELMHDGDLPAALAPHTVPAH